MYEDTWKAEEHELLFYVKNDLLSIAFCYARYTMGMEELTNFGLKNSSSLPSLANNYFKSLRHENDELIYTYTDSFMRNFVRQSIKGGWCNDFNQHFKSEICDDVFRNIFKKLEINGNISDLLEK